MDLNFSVYGLRDRAFQRTLDVAQRLWTPDGPWWYVSLSHRDPLTQNFVVVVTDAKLPRHEREADYVGPTGLADVRRISQLELAVATGNSSDALENSRRVGLGEMIGDTSTEQMIVGDHLITFQSSKRRGVWAADADLGDVAVAVYSNMSPAAVHLYEVNDELDSYL